VLPNRVSRCVLDVLVGHSMPARRLTNPHADKITCLAIQVNISCPTGEQQPEPQRLRPTRAPRSAHRRAAARMCREARRGVEAGSVGRLSAWLSPRSPLAALGIGRWWKRWWCGSRWIGATEALSL
jgi:hypothetical protein